jgi:Amt family ammonium transporter
METAGYIIVGAICERITFWAFLLAELCMGAIIYPVFGCWVWGGGWLSQIGTTWNLGHGYVDFAGSTVVHAVGGFAAMALAIILGPRLGKYGPDGKVRVFPAHNLVFVVTGTFILSIWLDGIQSGLDAGCFGPSHFGHRGQHQFGGRCRFRCSDVSLVLDVRKTRHHHGL